MSTKRLSELRQRWGKLVREGCEGCTQRREKIKKVAKSFMRSKRRVAVMFSGGLDSTYVAWKLKMGGNRVHLYHVKWTYVDGPDNSGELEAAIEIAEMLNLPIHMLGEVKVPLEHRGNIMRVPTIGSMMLCHRDLRFDTMATGMAPAISERDLGWHHVLSSMAEHCMPTLSIIHPRDGIVRSELKGKIPAFLADRAYSGADKKNDDQ